AAPRLRLRPAEPAADLARGTRLQRTGGAGVPGGRVRHGGPAARARVERRPLRRSVPDGPVALRMEVGRVRRRHSRPLGFRPVTFELLPAVDVADGQAVRLVQGRAGTETHYGAPLDAALAWQHDGAKWIHLVDLDAAFGRGSNAALLAEVVGKLDVKVELSGGIRDDDSLEAALATGCARV